MTTPLRPEFAFGGPQFDAFLYAPVGNDSAGLPLTVLSALTRLGLDPWGEAARLSNLSVGAATDALAEILARLPEGDWKKSDHAGIAIRLAAALPRGIALSRPSAPSSLGAGAPASSGTRWTFWLLCLVAAVGCFMLLSQLTASPPFESPGSQEKSDGSP